MKVSNNFAAFQFESGTGYPGWAPHPLGPLLPRRGEGEVLLHCGERRGLRPGGRNGVLETASTIPCALWVP